MQEGHPHWASIPDHLSLPGGGTGQRAFPPPGLQVSKALGKFFQTCSLWTQLTFPAEFYARINKTFIHSIGLSGKAASNRLVLQGRPGLPSRGGGTRPSPCPCAPPKGRMSRSLAPRPAAKAPVPVSLPAKEAPVPTPVPTPRRGVICPRPSPRRGGPFPRPSGRRGGTCPGSSPRAPPREGTLDPIRKARRRSAPRKQNPASGPVSPSARPDAATPRTRAPRRHAPQHAQCPAHTRVFTPTPARAETRAHSASLLPPSQPARSLNPRDLTATPHTSLPDTRAPSTRAASSALAPQHPLSPSLFHQHARSFARCFVNTRVRTPAPQTRAPSARAPHTHHNAPPSHASRQHTPVPTRTHASKHCSGA